MTKPTFSTDTARYFYDHTPAEARKGMRGYILHVLLDDVFLSGTDTDTGTCNLSVSRLAREIGCGVSTIQRELGELENLGEVERLDDGKGATRRYRLSGFLRWTGADQ